MKISFVTKFRILITKNKYSRTFINNKYKWIIIFSSSIKEVIGKSFEKENFWTGKSPFE
jgi:hypothetical protein